MACVSTTTAARLSSSDAVHEPPNSNGASNIGKKSANAARTGTFEGFSCGLSDCSERRAT